MIASPESRSSKLFFQGTQSTLQNLSKKKGRAGGSVFVFACKKSGAQWNQHADVTPGQFSVQGKCVAGLRM